MTEPTFLLVHGAFHGAWCWDPLLAELEHAGRRAVAIDLPGHGDDPGPFTDLAGDADRVRRQLDRLDAPVVLVGHSYGGVVITKAGAHPNVAHLVYLAAFAVTEDESAAAAAPAEAAAAELSHEGRPDLGGALRFGDDGTVSLDPDVAAEAFYNDCDAATTAWALARLEPHLGVALAESPGTAAWRTIESTYIVCENDQATHPGLQELLARRCSTTRRLPTGHFAQLADPQGVARLLGEVAD